MRCPRVENIPTEKKCLAFQEGIQCDEIWRKFATLAIICVFRNLFDDFFSISETFQPTLAHFCAIWHFFIVLNGQKSNH